MIRRSVLLAAILGLSSGAAAAAPYVVESTACQAGASSQMLIRIRHAPTGAYVANADVWHIDRHQSFKGPAPFTEVRHRMRSDADGSYWTSLPAQLPPSYERIVATIPGEAQPLRVTLPLRSAGRC